MKGFPGGSATRVGVLVCLGVIGVFPADARSQGAGKTPVAPVTRITVLSTNDLHGALDGVVLPEAAGKGQRLGGFAHVAGLLARLKAEDPARTLIVDAGDCFQGELAMNVQEGMACARFFNAAGYDARTVGNHEFDYVGCGPEDPARPPEDPQCALRKTLAESRQAIVVTNVREPATGRRVAWPNVVPWVVRDVGGVRVGLLGLLTPNAPRVSNRAGSVGLEFAALEGEVHEAAGKLRAEGATVVIVLAHVTGQCGRGSGMPGPGDLGCRVDGELRRLVESLKPGEVDLIVAGHAHAWLTGEKSKVPIVETPGQGSFVGRTRILVSTSSGRPLEGGVHVEPLVPVCREEDGASRVCGPQYAGFAGIASPQPEAAAVVAQAQAGVAAVCADVVAEATEDILTRRGVETPLGNLTADLMREAAAEAGPDGVAQWADVAFTNHGSVRDSLRKGVITRCDMHRVWPFDDPLVEVRLTSVEVQELAEFWVNVVKKVPAVSGVHITRYRDGKVAVRTPDNRLLDPRKEYRLVTTAYLLKGGDRLDSFLGRLQPDRIRTLTADPTYRDAFIRVLKARGRVAAPLVGRFEGL